MKGSATIPEVNGDDSFQLPVPATYVVNIRSVLRAAVIDWNYTQRMEPSDIVKTLAQI